MGAFKKIIFLLWSRILTIVNCDHSWPLHEIASDLWPSQQKPSSNYSNLFGKLHCVLSNHSNMVLVKTKQLLKKQGRWLVHALSCDWQWPIEYHVYFFRRPHANKSTYISKMPKTVICGGNSHTWSSWECQTIFNEKCWKVNKKSMSLTNTVCPEGFKLELIFVKQQTPYFWFLELSQDIFNFQCVFVVPFSPWYGKKLYYPQWKSLQP